MLTNTPARAVSVGDSGTFLECRKRRLDLAESSANLVRQFVRIGILLFDPVKLGLQGGTACTLLISEVDGLAVELARARGVAIWKVGSDRDPLPALRP
jgi:hypothetical protein